MRELDLDAARTARAEVRGDPPTIRLGGETFELPAELPMEYVWRSIEGEDREALGTLFNGDLERFLATNPTKDDIVALIAGIPALYGMGSEGESGASAGSSRNGGTSSRPTSSGTTASTSGRRASGKRRSV